MVRAVTRVSHPGLTCSFCLKVLGVTAGIFGGLLCADNFFHLVILNRNKGEEGKARRGYMLEITQLLRSGVKI